MPNQNITIDAYNTIESRFPADYKDHTGTRLENDRRLLPIADEIKSGKNIEHLERFAKAYLGMYLDMDNSIPPLDRIHILANPKLASLVHQGFAAVLHDRKFASPEQIADSIYADHLAEGYILVAALNIFGDKKRNNIKKLPANTLIAAICFNYAYKNNIHEQWLRSVFMLRPETAILAFTGFWQQLIRHNTDHLPGIYNLIRNSEYDNISSAVLSPILKDWLTIRKKLLRDLLRCALRTVDADELAKLSESAISNWNSADPGRYILWLAVAFLLQPAQHRSQLGNYVTRSKEKLMPLLDFCYWVLHSDQLTLTGIDADAYATLIRLIAARITPQKDRYGELCDNTRKVMFLFYGLACSANKHAAIKQLLQARVLKLYKSILEFIDTESLSRNDKTVPAQLDDFLAVLTQKNLIQLRIKWSD